MLNLSFTCRADNDLYRILADQGEYCPRYDDLWDAIEEAPDRSGVLSLADAYPVQIERVDAELVELARSKQLRLYVEYPLRLAGVRIGEPTRAHRERAIINSSFLSDSALPGAKALSPAALMAIHDCWYLPIRHEKPHMVLGRVAGFRKVAFSVPEGAPALLLSLDDATLVATTKLSQFVTGRYAPKQMWKLLWERILSWLGDNAEPIQLDWQAAVDLASDGEHPLAQGFEATALERSVNWFHKHALYSIDVKKGAIEGFESAIGPTGRQLARTWPRADCLAETAMALAGDWHCSGNPESKHRACEVLDYVWSDDFYHADPEDPAFGLSNWSERNPVFYGDDNARVILATLASRRMLQDSRWDERVLRCLLANLRTTGQLGFRRNRVNMADLADGPTAWRALCQEETLSLAPHYQAYLWACFVWAHALTGFEPFLASAKRAIQRTMEAYPAEWRWTNGLSQEMARMLLPLAFLAQAEDTQQHRSWLERMAGDLLSLQQPCGAIREKLGEISMGKYPPPQSNQAYGTTEASVIQADGDPVCDLLYTANFAFLGLHEARAALGDSNLRRATDRLAEFFCRIQVQSAAHPYLDGAWMRSFDYQLWEYWGSSADAGWGPWSVETGWTNAWINAVLAMRMKEESLYDTSMAHGLRAIAPRLIDEMGLGSA